MTIGQRIKYRREELNMSQEELAFKMGYKSRSSINKIELDLQNLKQSKIKAAADALETTPSYIMGWEEEPKVIDMPPKPKYDELSQSVIELLLKLDDSDKIEIRGEIRQMLKADKYTESEQKKQA